MKLTDVSKTAIVTLRCHVIESQKTNPLIKDPMAEYCLNRFVSLVSQTEPDQVFYRKLPTRLTNNITIRARKYDAIINDFISKHPNCTVVNLGCGFDTRYWRINNQHCQYIELDLPEVIAIKKELLKDKLKFELIDRSVLDTSWIDQVTQKGNRNILLIAEGLLMYLEKDDVIHLLKTFAARFDDSQIALEVVTEKYTKGFWKKIIILKMKKELGLEAGSSYNFGIKNAHELETYGNGIQVINEWSTFEDPDIRPRIFKYLGLSRTQWTVTAAINHNR
ncbi:MAG TPA: class I SAM-dependent methyltransferase [Bacillota bacterium]|nr:class I SAM-dependent methyltransferase [Bacillota bacterium]